MTRVRPSTIAGILAGGLILLDSSPAAIALFLLDGQLPDVVVLPVQLTLYAYVVYHIPRHFSNSHRSKWSPFWALITGIVIGSFLLWRSDPTPNRLLLLVGLSATIWILLTGIVYAWSRTTNKQSEPQRILKQLLRAVPDTEARSGVGANTGAVSLLIGGITLVIVWFAVFGITVADEQSPIFEIFVVGVATYNMAARQVAVLPDGPQIKTDILDAIFATFGSVLSTPLKGMMTVFVCLVGLSLAVTPLSLERETVFAFFKLLSDGTVPSETHVIVSVSVILYAVYGLWFWLQVLNRMPAFLDSYRREQQNSNLITGKRTVSSSRPMFWILPTCHPSER